MQHKVDEKEEKCFLTPALQVLLEACFETPDASAADIGKRLIVRQVLWKRS